MINWYIGQPIVAIKNSRCGKVKKGEEFIIKALSSCVCGRVKIDIGLPCDDGKRWTCVFTNTPTNETTHWKYEELFAPLDVDISELTGILEKELTHNTPTP